MAFYWSSSSLLSTLYQVSRLTQNRIGNFFSFLPFNGIDSEGVDEIVSYRIRRKDLMK